jgi:hypothetical protein
MAGTKADDVVSGAVVGLWAVFDASPPFLSEVPPALRPPGAQPRLALSPAWGPPLRPLGAELEGKRRLAQRARRRKPNGGGPDRDSPVMAGLALPRWAAPMSAPLARRPRGRADPAGQLRFEGTTASRAPIRARRPSACAPPRRARARADHEGLEGWALPCPVGPYALLTAIGAAAGGAGGGGPGGGGAGGGRAGPASGRGCGSGRGDGSWRRLAPMRGQPQPRTPQP